MNQLTNQRSARIGSGDGTPIQQPSERVPEASKRGVNEKGDARKPKGQGDARTRPSAGSLRIRVKSHDDDVDHKDVQRAEDHYNKWQLYKRLQCRSKHALLEQKVALQHDLIKAYDKQHVERRTKEQQQRAKLREAEQKEKRRRVQLLTQLGKNDIEMQRKARQQCRAAKKLATKLHQTCRDASNHLDGVDTPDALDMQHVVTGMGDAPRRLSVVSSSNEEEQSQQEDQEDLKFPDKNPTLSHQLIELFGLKKARYFLEAGTASDKEKDDKPIPECIMKQGGRGGAAPIWSTLRDESIAKLQKADAKIPQVLKTAYGAFARECLTNGEVVAKRCYYCEDRVPANETLQESRLLERLEASRKKVQLMYRVALANQDQAAILLFNNPLPDFNDGDDGPMKYHPSWDEQDDEDGSPGLKWLQGGPPRRPQNAQESIRVPKAPLRDDCSSTSSSLPDLPRHSKGFPKLSFLTEEDTRCAGSFRDRLAESATDRDKITLSKRIGHITLEPLSKRSLPNMTNSPVRNQPKVAPPTNAWQPLSLAALLEYTPSVQLLSSTSGAAQESMWKPIISTDM